MSSLPIRLGVNVDHVATLREQRKTPYPDPVYAALIAEQAGAETITVHLREDRRHIQERDVRLLKDMLQIRLNLEMAASAEMLAFALAIKPAACCLVPEKRAELTTEGGLEVAKNQDFLNDYCATLRTAGIEVSLFIDPDHRQIDAASAIGVPVIEIHTGRYADSKGEQQLEELEGIRNAVQHAHHAGLQVNAGHGLHLNNVDAIARISEIVELNIGHALVSHALWVGFPEAVKAFVKWMKDARRSVSSS